MTAPLTKEQIELAKVKQRAIIADCDKAIADLEANISYFQNAINSHEKIRKEAKETLIDLENDFPMVDGVTTAPGGIDAMSVIDATLIGSTEPMAGNSLRVYPDDPLKDDTQGIKAFDKATGKLDVNEPFKGGQVGKGVKFKVFKPIPAVAQ